MFITPLGDPSPLEIHVDASTLWGIGFTMNGKWLAWKLKPGWKIKGHEIGWAEMVAVELSLTALMAAGYSNAHFILRSNNKGVSGALKGGKSRNEEQNLALRHTVELFCTHS